MRFSKFFCAWWLAIVLTAGTQALSQPLIDSLVAADFEAARASLVLLRNDGDFLPLKNLERLRIASVNIGTENRIFPEVLSRYAPVVRHQWHVLHTGKVVEAMDPSQEMKAVAHFNLLIFSVYAGDLAYAPVRQALLQIFQTTFRQVSKVLFVYGSADALTNLPDAGVILFSERKDPFTLSLAAQMIFGAVGASGRLGSSTGHFPKGAGLTTQPLNRLGYAPPAVVGLDEGILFDSVGAIVEEGVRAGAFPGAQVLVAKDGRVVFQQAWGFHTYEQERPVHLADVYDLASITKVAASLPAIMRLCETSGLQLDQPLGQWYPAFRHSDKASLTLRRVLTHTAGLKAWIPFWKNTLLPDGTFAKFTFLSDSLGAYQLKVATDLYLHKNYRKQIFRAIRQSLVSPCQGYVYSDLSFYLYPEVVLRLTRQEFESWLKQEFYGPLGANTLIFNAYRHFPLSEIVPTERDTFFRKELIHGRVHDEGAAMLDGVSGHAGLFGAAEDLAKLFQMYLNGGEYGGRRYLQDSTIRQFTACAYCDEGVHRGIGFDKPLLTFDPTKSSSARSASAATFGHSGFTGTQVWADPEHNLLFIFLSNRVYPTRENRLLYELNIRPRIHQAIYDAMRRR
jgi:CubicO group peptidase (beta-lactamase class C family)